MAKVLYIEHDDDNLEMPVIDRWEPVRALKNDPQTWSPPIIWQNFRLITSPSPVP